MKKLFITLFAAIAFFAATPATAQTADADYNLYGHLVGVNENNGIYKFTTEATYSGSENTLFARLRHRKGERPLLFLRTRRLGLRCRNVYVHLQRQRFYLHYTP